MKLSEFKKSLITEVRRILKEAVRVKRDELIEKIKATEAELKEEREAVKNLFKA